MTEGSGYKELPQNTHIPYLKQKQSASHALEEQFVKKENVKPSLGSQILFSPQNYVLFAIITMSTFCAQFVTWNSADLIAFSRSIGDSQLFNSSQEN